MRRAPPSHQSAERPGLHQPVCHLDGEEAQEPVWDPSPGPAGGAGSANVCLSLSFCPRIERSATPAATMKPS